MFFSTFLRMGITNIMDSKLQLQVNFDPLKYESQLEAFNEWKRCLGKGTIVAATGSGKTEIGLMAIRENHSKGRSSIVLVHRDGLKEQWIGQVEGLNCQVLTKQYVINQNSLKTDLLIDDELHRSTGDEFVKTHSIISHNYFMGLTATPRTENLNWIKIISKYPIIYEKGIQESLDNKFIADFEIYNIAISLNGADLALVMKMNEDYNSIAKIFGGNFGVISNCLKPQNFNLRVSIGKENNLFEKAVLGKAAMAMGIVGKRAKFLRNHPGKISVILDLINSNHDKTIITYSQNIEPCEEIYSNLDPLKTCIVHSKRPKKEKGLELFIQDINKTTLCSAQALGDGIDIPRLDMGICHSFNSSDIDFNQMLGRVTRNTLDKDKVAKFYVTYCKGTSIYKTQEESWLEKAQSKIPKEKIKWV